MLWIFDILTKGDLRVIW